MKETGKTVKMLDWLRKQKNGARLIDIQQFLWSLSHKDGSRVPPGYWCTTLYNTGLLRTFADKRDGRWHRNNKPHRGKPHAIANASPARRRVLEHMRGNLKAWNARIPKLSVIDDTGKVLKTNFAKRASANTWALAHVHPKRFRIVTKGDEKPLVLQRETKFHGFLFRSYGESWVEIYDPRTERSVDVGLCDMGGAEKIIATFL